MTMMMKNRELKFRAWDDTLLRYLPPLTFKEIAERDFSETNWSQISIEQFTGLRDANGVEIYEGDIVELPDVVETLLGESFKIRGRVTYISGGFYFRNDDGWVDPISRHGSSVVIIGNIHENPELLTK